jgi:hypothetical protein
MTPSSCCKLIDFNAYRQHHRLTPYCNAQSSVHRLSEKNQKLNQACQLHHTNGGLDFEDQLQAFEDNARQACLKIYDQLAIKRLHPGLAEMLSQRILPTLDRIGFDRRISKVFFQIVPSAWNIMGPIDESIKSFQPLIDREVEMVRQGFKRKYNPIKDGFSPPSAAPPGTIPGSVKEGNFPEHLFEMLEDIAIPWIILPRAYRFLKKDHCCYLPAYLKILNTDKREICLNLFSRITIEFMGNFSCKFADRRHPRDQILKLLFYGYAALFWKTLRCPPVDMENNLTFDHFFIWLKRLATKNDSLGNQEKLMFNQMTMMKTRAFPPLNAQSFRNCQQPDSARFLVTLRHGHPGIAATLRFFGIDQFLKTRRTGRRFLCLSFQKELHRLLYKIRTNYHSESKPTRENVKHFINGVKVASNSQPPDFNRTQQQFVDRLIAYMQRFVQT